MSGLRAVMAARESIELFDQISPEELREYYQHFGCGLPYPCLLPSAIGSVLLTQHEL